MKRTLYILSLATVVMATGCKKSYLELKPYDQVALDIAIQTEGDMQAATNGIYSAMRNSSLYGRDVQLRADVLGDNAYISTTNSNRFLEYSAVNYTPVTASVGTTWNAAYSAILRANNVINSSIAANTNTNQYRGEALTLRALLYFDLVKQFAKTYTAASASTDLGVPLVLTYDPTLKPVRSTVQQVYDQVEKDLLAAIPLLTDRVPYSAGYVNKNTAKALLARMYEFKADWAKALTNAQDVINNGGYTLTSASNHAAYWSLGTLRTDKLESLFELGFDPTGNAGLESLPYFFLQSGYGDALAADAFFNTFSTTDTRRALMVDAVRGSKNVKVINKYPSNINYTIKIVRLSEVYLIAAEAAYQTGATAQALVYLNQIATRRDPAFAGYASAGPQLLEDILTERRKELAFEGHRYWDLQRYNRDVVRVNINSNYASNVPLLFAKDNFRRILPIPQGETDANPNIKPQQNPGY
ncbi:MAG: RagB/SusD family nutrient uptake outer membrane protein [Chitinophagaceae bacterium]|nr:RagB/SusD family nutrient uptake outer membrane protein [Chitinophagaceae bacterium]